MSRNNNNRNASNAPRTPCCKVCQDAGKPASVFGSHWPKDLKGNVVCPTLLAQECRWCGECGHTVKYCQKLAAKNASDEKRVANEQRQARYQETAEKKAPAPAAKAASRFALLMDDDSDDESEKKKAEPMKEEFPALGGNWAKLQAPTPVPAVSFAEMACKPKEQAIAEKKERDEERLAQAIREGFVSLKEPKPVTPAPFPMANVKSEAAKKGGNARTMDWASWDDDEDDDYDNLDIKFANYSRDIREMEDMADEYMDQDRPEY